MAEVMPMHCTHCGRTGLDPETAQHVHLADEPRCGVPVCWRCMNWLLVHGCTRRSAESSAGWALTMPSERADQGVPRRPASARMPQPAWVARGAAGCDSAGEWDDTFGTSDRLRMLGRLEVALAG